MIKEATISKCGTYRYLLTRRWAREPIATSMITWIMLNPSTADENEDDPTIRRCIQFSKNWNFGGMYIVNLFAYRSTDPAKLKSSAIIRGQDVIGPENNNFIGSYALHASRVVCGWGNHGNLLYRGQSVLSLLAAKGVHPLCLQANRNGTPKHPLYISYKTKLKHFT